MSLLNPLAAIGRWLLAGGLALGSLAQEAPTTDAGGLVIVAEGETPPSRILSQREDLQVRAQTAIANAVLHLRALARKEDNRLFYPPARTSRVSGYKEYERRYSSKTVEEPIYKTTYKYETYETIANVRSGGSLDGAETLQKVKRQRVIGVEHEQTGTRTVTRLVEDKDGEIVQTHRYPIYEPGGPDHLYPGFWANNAMAIYTLAKLGVPLDDPDFALGIQSLANYVEGFGLPDRTIDLAWLTAAFSQVASRQPDAAPLAKRLLNKLLLAQQQNDPAKGLWGPVAINLPLLANMIFYEQDLYNKEVTAWQEKLAKNPKSELYAKKIKDGKETAKAFRGLCRDITMQGLGFDAVRQNMTLTPPDEFLVKVAYTVGASTISGLPVNIYAESLADLEHTALALMAIREAAEAGLLVDKVVVPKTYEGRPLASFPDTSKLLEQAAAAVAKLQTKDGAFTEGNFWLPVHEFDKLGLPGLPVDDKKFIALESPVTQLSTAQGHSALLDVVRVMGDAGLKQYGAALERSEAAVLGQAATVVERQKTTIPVGGARGQQHPYYFFGFLNAALRGPAGPEASNAKLWQDLAEYLIVEQPKAGPFWAKAGAQPYWALSTVFTPWSQAVQQRAHEAAQAKQPVEKRKPWNPKAWNPPDGFGSYSLRELTNSTMAIMALQQGIRPPVAGTWAYDGKASRLTNVRPVVEFLAKKHKTNLEFVQVAPGLPPTSLEGVPVLVITGRGQAFVPTGDKALDHLRHYLLNLDGLLVAEVSADADGAAFAKSLGEALIKLFPEAKVGPLPVKDKEPPVNGVLDGGGRPLLAILPVQTQAGGPGLNNTQIRQFIFGHLNATLKEAVLRPTFAMDWEYVQVTEPEFLRNEEDARNKALEDAATKAAAAGAAGGG